MKIIPPPSRQAFTLIDGLVAVCIVALLFFLLIALLPALAGYQHRHHHYSNCMNNLKQVGISFRIWQGDNNDKYPMNVPVALGGAQEMMATGNVAACFQVMSNELATPKILVCPADPHRTYATNFDATLTRTNISYFLALDVSEADPQAVLSGDDNLIRNRQPASPGILNLTTAPATWTSDRHHGAGNILLVDGSVQAEVRIGAPTPPGPGFATNRIVVP